MNQTIEPPQAEADSPWMSRAAPALQWFVLLAVSAALIGTLELAGVPAALLIGPMLGGIAMGVSGATARVPLPAFSVAQGIIGCLIASSVSADIFPLLYVHWPPIMGAVLATLAASSFLGWLISRWRILPGTTALWGSTPGAAAAMVLMAGAFGADQRLVAVMQYLRVIIISVSASLVASLWVDTTQMSRPDIVWFPVPDALGLTTTLGVAILGSQLGRLLRLPSPFFLGSMILGMLLHLGIGLDFDLPQWLLGMSYALIGWHIGLGFTRPVLHHAMRALPQMIGSIAALLIFCGALGWLMSRTLGIDPMTAYLATSPGAMETIAIIAAATHNVDMSFVMALQTARFLLVLLVGPPLARFFARTVAA
ncbi:membrane AbrB-like protein [Aquamicrobium terrae]|uniref:Membrane AbrB-like protein n=2 Tax=Aquamicrobium terrae TaxID=1324945 RepID=A0ABV2MYE7_9HYPH